MSVRATCRVPAMSTCRRSRWRPTLRKSGLSSAPRRVPRGSPTATPAPGLRWPRTSSSLRATPPATMWARGTSGPRARIFRSNDSTGGVVQERRAEAPAVLVPGAEVHVRVPSDNGRIRQLGLALGEPVLEHVARDLGVELDAPGSLAEPVALARC